MADLTLEYLDFFNEIIRLTEGIETSGEAKRVCEKVNKLAKQALDLEE